MKDQQELFDAGPYTWPWREYQAEVRRDLAAMLEEELRPVVDSEGDALLSQILDRAIAIVKGE